MPSVSETTEKYNRVKRDIKFPAHYHERKYECGLRYSDTGHIQKNFRAVRHHNTSIAITFNVNNHINVEIPHDGTTLPVVATENNNVSAALNHNKIAAFNCIAITSDV
eukprot:scpid109126/ scgid8716/ 